VSSGFSVCALPHSRLCVGCVSVSAASVCVRLANVCVSVCVLCASVSVECDCVCVVCEANPCVRHKVCVSEF
jgi:hypothetical protein